MIANGLVLAVTDRLLRERSEQDRGRSVDRRPEAAEEPKKKKMTWKRARKR